MSTIEMGMNRAGRVRDFKARATNSLQAYLMLTAFLVAPALIIWLLAGFLPPFVPWGVTGTLLFIALVLLVAGYVADRAATSVHYGVSDRDVILTGGPVRYTIPLSSIKRIYTRDLNLGVRNRAKRGVTGVRMPNLALGPVKYNDTGPLKMCATSSSERITIIETEGDNYGVTPADEEGFKAALGVIG